MSSFTKKLIVKSFKATGINLLNTNVIPSCFVKTLEDLDID
jgi:hypothetical protein